MIRTHEAGALALPAHLGQTVTLTGWVARRRDHGGVTFIDLRDASGIVQVVIRDEESAHALRNEYCLKVVGEVVARSEGNVNPNLATGEVEVVVTELEVLNASAPLGRAGLTLPSGRRPTGPVTAMQYSLRRPDATASSRITTWAMPLRSRRSMKATPPWSRRRATQPARVTVLPTSDERRPPA